MRQITSGGACKRSWFLEGVPSAACCPTRLHDPLGLASLLSSLGVLEHPLWGRDPHPGPLYFWIDPPGPSCEGGKEV